MKSVQHPDVPEGLAQAGLDLPLDGLPVGVPVGWRVARVYLMGHITSGPHIPSLFLAQPVSGSPSTNLHLELLVILQHHSREINGHLKLGQH